MALPLQIQDRFNKDLPADPDQTNTRRQIRGACFSYVTPRKPSKPSLIHVSSEMLSAIGLKGLEHTTEFLDVFSGAKVMKDTHPYAMAYAGHQFGQWAGQLGDGRAINLVEVVYKGKHWALQLKGAGETPYSRSADGLAVLRSSIREFLCSEAMYHLGVPTTRALSLILTGDKVLRDILYDGNPEYEKGAIVCRAAESFIRFGNFEHFAAHQNILTLQKLVDFTVKNHFSHLGKPGPETYLKFFSEVTVRSMEMVIHWQRVGFVHGVMNTDNMSILGLTIDYGPYGWLEGYDQGWTPNTTDRMHKRYRFGTQPQIVLWNLIKLANALYPLIEDRNSLESILDTYYRDVTYAYTKMMKSKLGLIQHQKEDVDLLNKLEQALQLSETDMTIFFRLLGTYGMDKDDDGIEIVHQAFYKPEEISGAVEIAWKNWFASYRKRLDQEKQSQEDRMALMNAVNPKYVLRNYMAQLAIDAADQGDYSVLKNLFNLLKKPYDAQPDQEKWFAKRPEWARHKVGCSMLSCSS